MQLQAVQANQAACWRQHLRRFKRDYRRDRCEGLKLARDPSDGVERRSELAEIWKQHNPYTSPLQTKALPSESTRRRREQAWYESERPAVWGLPKCQGKLALGHTRSCAYDSTPLIITRRKPYRSDLNPLLRKETPRAAHKGVHRAHLSQRHCKPAKRRADVADAL